MTKYKGIVTEDFITRRNEIASTDTRTGIDPYRQWDFEFVEFHQASLNNGHTVYEGYEYDTTHKFFGNCDFKHVNSKREVTISAYIRDKLERGIIDNIVAWSYIKKDWSKNFEVGDAVHYQIIGYIPRDLVLDALKTGNETHGLTIKGK